jgi:formylglycine-generating enzyme required for sulfatase activity
MTLKRLLQTSVLLLTALLAPSTASAAHVEVGDVNSDGYVNIGDVTGLINYLVTDDATGIDLQAANCNRDDDVNIGDLTVLINYLLTDDWPYIEPVGETFTVNGVSFKMVTVDGGTFTMGATAEQGSDAYDSEKPAHQVTLSGYSIGETEVTQALWQAVMGSNPSFFSPANGYSENLQRPVEYVSWNDCQEFITKLNQMTGKTFRLPTEAEWEYAARGGNKSQGYKYAGSNDIDEVAWYRVNAYEVGSSSPDYGTHTVATKLPNELGLYDMSGNVYEWCQDWYGSYSGEAQTNPTGPDSGTYRVIRGGCWHFNAWNSRLSRRFSYAPDKSWSHYGLRLAL